MFRQEPVKEAGAAGLPGFAWGARKQSREEVVEMERQRRIVVGVSGSLGSLAALHRSVDEARRSDSEVLAVLAWLPPGGEYGYRRSPCPPLLAAVREAAVERLRTALDEAFGGAGAGVRLSSQVFRGDTGPALVQSADRPDDVLVVGAGRGSWFRPSVARYCLRHAGCPVLAVPRPALQRELETYHRRLLWHLRQEPVDVRL